MATISQIAVRRDFKMTQVLSFGSAIARIADSKKHSHRSEKVKA